MKSLLVILATVLISCHALAFGGDTMEYPYKSVGYAESQLKSFLENFRHIMKTGNSSLGLPILDPLQVDQQAVNLHEQLVSLDALLTNVKVDGLSEYAVQTADFTIIGIRINMALNWDQVTAHTGYAMKGIAADTFPLYGLGDIDATVNGFHFGVKVGLSVRDSHLYVKSLTSELSLKKLDFKATGLYDDEELSGMLSAIISDLVPQLVTDYQDMVTGMLNKVLTKVLDQYLSTMTIKDLLGLLS